MIVVVGKGIVLRGECRRNYIYRRLVMESLQSSIPGAAQAALSRQPCHPSVTQRMLSALHLTHRSEVRVLPLPSFPVGRVAQQVEHWTGTSRCVDDLVAAMFRDECSGQYIGDSRFDSCTGFNTGARLVNSGERQTLSAILSSHQFRGECCSDYMRQAGPAGMVCKPCRALSSHNAGSRR